MFLWLHVLLLLESPPARLRRAAKVERRTLSWEFVQQYSWDDYIKGRAKIQKQNPGIGFRGIHVMDDYVEVSSIHLLALKANCSRSRRGLAMALIWDNTRPYKNVIRTEVRATGSISPLAESNVHGFFS